MATVQVFDEKLCTSTVLVEVSLFRFEKKKTKNKKKRTLLPRAQRVLAPQRGGSTGVLQQEREAV